MRRTLASDGPAAALALAFVQGVLAVGLGERVPPRVALSTFGVEAALAWLLLALPIAGLAFVPGFRRLAGDRGLRQVLLLAGVGFAVGSSGLSSAAPPRQLQGVATGWLIGHALAVLLLQRALRAAGRLPEAGLAAFPARAVVAAAVPLASLTLIARHLAADAPPLELALIQGGAGILGLTLALAVGRRPVAPARRAESGLRGALLQAACAAALIFALALARHEPGPRRPWREIASPDPRASATAGAPDLAAAAPNVVLVSIDTLRSDHVGAYGYARDTTPVLDGLAREGALFDPMVATAPWTLPSHGSLFTGRYPGDLAGYRITGTPSLGPLLHARGYRTAAFTAGYVMGEPYFAEGFDFFADDYEEAYVLGLAPTFLHAALRVRRGIRHFGLGFPPLNPLNHWRLERGGVNAFAGPAPGADAAADWIREHGRGGPFFLFFHTFGAHEYYLATEEMRRQADRWAGDYQGWMRATSLRFGSRMPATAEELRYLVALYDASIHMSDAALGLVLRALDEAGVADRTLVVVTSDHGEGFRPDLGRTWHTQRLHDDLLRVPLVMRLPGRIPEGLRVSAQASGLDVLPTIFALLDVETPAGVRGRSLVPLLAGTAASPEPEDAFSQVADYDSSYQGAGVRSQRFKYILTRQLGEEFYDLELDPQELRNLSLVERRSETFARLRRQLAEFERTISQETPELDEHTADQLRALGYMDGP